MPLAHRSLKGRAYESHLCSGINFWLPNIAAGLALNHTLNMSHNTACERGDVECGRAKFDSRLDLRPGDDL